MFPIYILLVFACQISAQSTTPAQLNGESEHLKVLIATGSEFFAGTDARVAIELGTISDLKLKFNLPNGTKFPRYRQLAFSIDSKIPLSDICSITVSQDNTGKRPEWFLRDISVKNDAQKVVFPFNTWLTRSEPNKTISTCSTKPFVSKKIKEEHLTPAMDHLAPPSSMPPGMMVAPPGVYPPGELVPPGAPPVLSGPPGIMPGVVGAGPPPPCPDSLPLPSCKINCKSDAYSW